MKSLRLLLPLALVMLSACSHRSNAPTVIYSSQVISEAAPPTPDRERALNFERASDLSVYFVDVGQGDCTLVEWPNGTWSLIDCGTSSGADPREVRDYIHDKLGSSPRLVSVILTHSDSDHINFIPYILDGVRVDKVYYTGKITAYSKRVKSPDSWPLRGKWKQVSDWMRDFPRKQRLSKSDVDPEGSDSDWFEKSRAKVYLIAAGVPEARSDISKTNALSIVLFIEYGKFNAMLTGDATTSTEEFITGKYSAGFLDTDLLKIGHHGSSTTSTSDEWARIVRPRISVSSNSYKNSHGHARWEVINRLAKYADSVSPTHRLRAYFKQSKPYTRSNYDKAIYTTGGNGNVVVHGKANDDYVILIND